MVRWMKASRATATEAIQQPGRHLLTKLSNSNNNNNNNNDDDDDDDDDDDNNNNNNNNLTFI